MKLVELFETHPLHNPSDYAEAPASEIKVRDQYKNEDWGKKQKVTRQKVVVRGKDRRVYGVRNTYQK